MIHAYDKLYLEKARTALGRMLDFAVYDLEYSLADFWQIFLNSNTVKRFEHGDPSILVGKSGVELAYEIIGRNDVQPRFSVGRSEEYWTGWALAYYQWETGLTFNNITEKISIDEICCLYSPYHEMDIRQFCDKMNELYNSRKTETNLKRIRTKLGFSQLQLANETGIPIRTIQQYEQGQKNINKAQAEYIIKLAKALYCEPSELLELI
jgi:DNA-binding transcriptional regulator YiaG